MRISDWSSDVCSSDLLGAAPIGADLDFRYPLRAKRPLYQRQHGVDGGRERRRFVVRACPVLLLRALAEMVPDVLIQFPIRPARLLHPLQEGAQGCCIGHLLALDRKSTRLNSSH